MPFLNTEVRILLTDAIHGIMEAYFTPPGQLFFIAGVLDSESPCPDPWWPGGIGQLVRRAQPAETVLH